VFELAGQLHRLGDSTFGGPGVTRWASGNQHLQTFHTRHARHISSCCITFWLHDGVFMLHCWGLVRLHSHTARCFSGGLACLQHFMCRAPQPQDLRCTIAGTLFDLTYTLRAAPCFCLQPYLTC
jgi:hypothetical protein